MKALVIGYGSIGKRHIDNLSSFPKMEIFVCTKQKYDDFLRKKRCKVFSSVKEALKERPDIALITNVTSHHVKTAIKLANSGISLFIEKPLSNSLRGVQTLLDVIKRRRLVTLIGCNLRFHPCIKKIKELISKNEIGRVISVRVENGSYLPGWHPYEDYRNSYAATKDFGGGVVLTCIHELDYLYWFFGDVKEVFSITGKFSNLDLSVDDLSSILLRFANNVIAEVHLDYFQNPNFRSCKIIGTKGTIYWDSEINAVKVYDIKKKKWITKLKLQNYDNNTMYVDELSHFLKYVRIKEKTINPVIDGAKTLRIALAIKQASKIKKMVEL
ncbi:MAG: Gfo/Idh/MocA family protein [Nitrosopumilaceae archaeon]